jgi:hypothetical protein
MADRSKGRERMRAVLERWQRSGQSQAAFARRNRIHPQKLSYWKRVLGLSRQRGVDGDQVAARAPFVPVRLVGLDPATPSGTLEIVLGGECRLVVREGVSRELLREVLSALRREC